MDVAGGRKIRRRWDLVYIRFDSVREWPAHQDSALIFKASAAGQWVSECWGSTTRSVCLGNTRQEQYYRRKKERKIVKI
jgi:hypothetical protein